MEVPKCDFCGRKANVLYEMDSWHPDNYKGKILGFALCRVCDSIALKALKRRKDENGN